MCSKYVLFVVDCVYRVFYILFVVYLIEEDFDCLLLLVKFLVNGRGYVFKFICLKCNLVYFLIFCICMFWEIYFFLDVGMSFMIFLCYIYVIILIF